MDRNRSAAAVRERLLQAPGMMALPATGAELFVLRDFLDPAECAGLIALIDAGRKPSRILDGHPDPSYRTSESCDLDPADPVVRRVEAKLSALTGIPIEQGETIQGQRYAAGQEFKAHYDFFDTAVPSWKIQEQAGGQRSWTAMAFLNAPERGGRTFFPEARMRVTPRPGNLLVWNNLHPDGTPNPMTLHQGLPVEAGVKYIVTKWYRERIWRWVPDG